MYQIYVYIPVKFKEAVKSAMFEAGAGKIGSYSHCSFEYHGEGQFLPQEGSDPYLGSQGTVEKVEEVKVELVCNESNIQKAIAALKAAHPYEAPAYGVIKLLDY